jgi:hypothetical protein
MLLIIEGICLQDGHILVRHACVFFTINPIETRSLFCWKLCNADFSPQHYPNPGKSKILMPYDFKIIKLVRANFVAYAIFFQTALKLFRKNACGFSSPNQYSQDVDTNGKPMGFSALLIFLY